MTKLIKLIAVTRILIIVSIDFQRLIETIDDNRLIIIHYIDNDQFSWTGHRLGLQVSFRGDHTEDRNDGQEQSPF